MTVEVFAGGVVVTGEKDTSMTRLFVLKAALSLELHGMKRRGRSAYAIIKSEFNLKGNKAKVYDLFCDLVKEKKRERSGS